jgi:23S rRNA (uracil1939-C5)-methyltransferase
VRLTIEKLIYGGDGLARLTTADQRRARAVLVPFVLPGEEVKANPVEEKPGFVRAALETILVPSSERIAPLCPYFQRCGGCHYQHTGYDQQLVIKREILRETLQRTAKIRWEGEIPLHSSAPWNYRNRTRLKIGTAPFALGYYRYGSHDLLPVENCPISSPLINRAISALWEIGRDGIFNSYPIAEIEFFVDHDDTRLMLELYATTPKSEREWEVVVGKLRAKMPMVASVAIFSRRPPPKKGRRRSDTGEPQLDACFSTEPFVYQTHEISYQVSPGSFFQTNRFLTERLLELVCAEAHGTLALDLYAGVGLFSAALARSFQHVEAVEIAPASFNDLRENVPRNVSVHQMTTAAYLTTAAGRKNPDLVVVDPPRAGLGEEVSRKLAAIGAARLTYVSCDPATLARDLNIFLRAGYDLQQLDLVDLFPETYHIETVAQLVGTGRTR